jgi:uncharacterized membrane protein
MAYCNQCGRPVGDKDLFCANCGGRQPLHAQPVPDYMSGVSPRAASLLCYIPVLGWLAAIVVLASNRFRKDTRVRFHAFQGLYLFVAWLIVDWVLSPMFAFSYGFGMHHLFPSLLKALIFGTWIFMIIKVSQDQMVKLPILGDLAEKSVSEQR